jgi:hypothetical protein
MSPGWTIDHRDIDPILVVYRKFIHLVVPRDHTVSLKPLRQTTKSSLAELAADLELVAAIVTSITTEAAIELWARPTPPWTNYPSELARLSGDIRRPDSEPSFIW